MAMFRPEPIAERRSLFNIFYFFMELTAKLTSGAHRVYK